MMPYLEAAMERVPASKSAGVHKFFCGPESFTPDLSPIMGEAPNLQNFYVAAGFNSLGILLGGGAGKIMAQWIADGYPSVDISKIDIRRTMPIKAIPTCSNVVEMLGIMYTNDFQSAAQINVMCAIQRCMSAQNAVPYWGRVGSTRLVLKA
jgi:4-methylaminobutanoate oxidase (formaldehyde-forming)